MASAETTTDTVGPRPTVLRWVGLALAAGLALLLAVRMSETTGQPNGPTTAKYGISQSHCAQFIALAKAKYGSDWKYRLDPRDTTCAVQIQHEWEHQWNPRLPAEPLQQPTTAIGAPIAPPLDASPLPVDAHLPNPETYCLNVISLAQARYGVDWVRKVAPTEAESCSAQIQKAAGR